MPLIERIQSMLPPAPPSDAELQAKLIAREVILSFCEWVVESFATTARWHDCAEALVLAREYAASEGVAFIEEKR